MHHSHLLYLSVYPMLCCRDQRLCVTPDKEFFHALKSGKVEMVTDTIQRFTADGILLTSGE